MVSHLAQHRHESDQFNGFEPLDSNYVYCPNQFLDLCLRNHSRGCVRVIGYVLRQTLGWLDSQGNPISQEINVTWNELIRHAGVSRGAITSAVKEAVESGFLQQLQIAHASERGKASTSNVLALRWSDSAEYHKTPDDFDGFFGGEGYRTPVPNAFFDRIIPSEPLAVSKVVGAVLRHTVGYQTQFGGRRQSAPLSFRFIAEYANLSTGRVLASAVTDAIDRGYVQCLSIGSFHSNASNRTASQYTIRWRLQAAGKDTSSKKPPAEMVTTKQFNKAISSGSESPPADRFNKATKEKTTKKETNKQQVAVSQKSVISGLTNEGMDERTATDLINQYGKERASQQLTWLQYRNSTKNRVGLLRKSIEEDWSAPPAVQRRRQQKEARKTFAEQKKRDSAEDEKNQERKRLRSQRRQRLIEEWGSADSQQRRQWIEKAAKRQTSRMIADMIRRESPNKASPMMQVLDTLAAAKNLPPVSELSEESLPAS